MGVLSSLRRLFSSEPAGGIRVRVILKGRTESGWHDVDQSVSLPPGATLGVLIDACERRGIRLRAAIESSPHLRHTLMLNGERCPVDPRHNAEAWDRNRRVEFKIIRTEDGDTNVEVACPAGRELIPR